jgi:hypothetical protein
MISKLIRLTFFSVLGFAAILCVNTAAAQVNVGDSDIVVNKNQSRLPPMASPEKVNGWVLTALRLSYKELAGKGRFECRHAVVDKERGDFNFVGRGDSYEMAHARSAGVCMKRRCEKLDETIKQAQESTKNLSDEHFVELLESLGKTQAEIEVALAARKAPADLNAPPTTCLNAAQDFRDFIYISCSITPIECRER